MGLFSIPMRGNEVMLPCAARASRSGFSIPMRGNEYLRDGMACAYCGEFSIPIRGNEVPVCLFTGAANTEVFDPHEG